VAASAAAAKGLPPVSVRHKLNSWILLQHLAKGLHVPEGGWTRATFAQHGTLLMLSMARVAKITQRKAIPEMALKARNIFRDQISRLLTFTTGRDWVKHQFQDRPLVDILFPQHEALWLQAIQNVFDDGDARIVRDLTPSVQSVMAQGYSKVNILLGQPGVPDASARIATRARGLAEKITRVNDTTRAIVARIVRESVDQGRTVTETAQEILDRTRDINDNRVMTIARTELGRAYDQGAVMSFKESSSITELSVLGCTAREPSSPHYKGQSTCAYQGLPIEELDAFMETGFHINHGGCLTPSGFR
jgi:hypothetical protein